MEGAPLFNVCFNPAGELLAGARECEAAVFLRAYGNTPDQLADEYGPYEDRSVFIALSDPDGLVVGAVRLILPDPGEPFGGLKSLHDTAGPPWSLDVTRSVRAARLDLSQTWDVATIGYRRGLKGAGRLASAALFHSLIQAVRANEVASAVMIIDERVRGLLAAAGMFGRTLPGAEPARYLGSAASTPVYEHCAPAFDRQRTVNPDAHRLFVQGIGLDGISVPGLTDFRLPTAVPAELPGVAAGV